MRDEAQVNQVALVGYSYGAACLCQVLCQFGGCWAEAPKPLAAAVMLALPVTTLPAVEDSGPAESLRRFCANGMRLGLIHPGLDRFCPLPSFMDWCAVLQDAATVDDNLVPSEHPGARGPQVSSAVALN